MRSSPLLTRALLPPASLLAFVASVALAALARAAPGDTELLSAGPDGTAAGSTFVSAISNDGRYVVLNSTAPAYFPAGAILRTNIFVRDRQSGTLELVSLTTAGLHDTAGCDRAASISADGRYVAFACSGALVAGDTNQTVDVFVRDRQAATTQRVSVSSAGAQATNGNSYEPSISADGRYVAFTSFAANLVTGDTNDRNDVFVRDRQLGTTQRVSVSPGGAQGNDDSTQPTISGDGRFISYLSEATNFFSNDANFAPDAFLFDRQAGTTQLISTTASGEPNPGFITDRPFVSATGRYVTFEASQPVVVRDRLAAGTEAACVSAAGELADAFCRFPTISADGRYVAFLTNATNLVADDTNGDPDVYVRDRELGVTQRVSVTSSGQQGFVGSDRAFISADGRFVAFASADPLVPSDHNAGSLGSDAMDAYIHEIGAPFVAPFTLTPGSLDFGRYAFGAASPARTVSLENTGAAALAIQSIALSGPNPQQFTVASHCGTALAVGATCAIDVSLKAANVGVKLASLDVKTSAGALSVQLRGEGAAAFYAVSPSSVAFGKQAVGTRSTRRNVDVLNLGDVPLPIRSIRLGGTNPGQFGFNTTCGSSVPVDDSGDGFCRIGVVFKPTSAGPKTATITVKVAGGAGDRTVTLTGRGVLTSGP